MLQNLYMLLYICIPKYLQIYGRHIDTNKKILLDLF